MDTTLPLDQKTCRPCEGGVAPLDETQIVQLLASLPEWERSGPGIQREISLKDHYRAQAFANAVMWISHREDHHPELTIGYRSVRVHYWTHAIGGLSENDFICAAKVDALLRVTAA